MIYDGCHYWQMAKYFCEFMFFARTVSGNYCAYLRGVGLTCFRMSFVYFS